MYETVNRLCIWVGLLYLLAMWLLQENEWYSFGNGVFLSLCRVGWMDRKVTARIMFL